MILTKNELIMTCTKQQNSTHMEQETSIHFKIPNIRDKIDCFILGISD